MIRNIIKPLPAIAFILTQHHLHDEALRMSESQRREQEHWKPSYPDRPSTKDSDLHICSSSLSNSKKGHKRESAGANLLRGEEASDIPPRLPHPPFQVC